MSQSFVDILAELERDLSTGVYSGYLPKRIPDPLDAKIAIFIDWFLDSDELEQGLLSCLPANASEVLLVFAERQAALAVRSSSMRALPASAVAIGMAAAIADDEREGMLVMPLPWRAAAMLGVHQAHLFASNASKVPGKGAQALLAFVSRKPEDQSLDCMGYREGSDADGFRFERTW